MNLLQKEHNKNIQKYLGVDSLRISKQYLKKQNLKIKNGKNLIGLDINDVIDYMVTTSDDKEYGIFKESSLFEIVEFWQ